jgi:hypothetical protein
MKSYFARHEIDRKGKGWNSKSHPSPGRVAWELWGGDEGRAWADRVLDGEYRQNPEIIDEQYAPGSLGAELQAAAQRAMDSGAIEPLTYVGAGMTGIVFVDALGVAYKVYRWLSPTSRSGAVDEYEWLMAASEALGSDVAIPLWLDRDRLVLAREYIEGKAGGWASNLYDHHMEIDRAMRPYGWTAPEFKEDSYIFPASSPKAPVLVDASMPRRIGDALLQYVDEIIAGDRPWFDETPSSLGFALRMEVYNGTIERDDANERLSSLGQDLAREE